MGKKYIVDLNNETQIIVEVGANSTGAATIASNPVSFLKPYTEPDLEQVRKEAYEQGYKKCLSEHDFDSPCVSCDEYKRGLADAWEAARKICTNWVLPDSVLSEIFGMDKTIDDIMKETTASEAIEKIRQYEQEKEMDGLRQNIQTIVDQCGYTLDEIAEVLKKMREE